MSSGNQTRINPDFIETGVIEQHRLDELSDEAIDSMAKSILTQGLLQPLLIQRKRIKDSGKQIVDPDGTFRWTRYWLIDGRTRLAAIRRIRQTDPDAFSEVSCVLYEGNEGDAYAAALEANLERRTLSTAEQARGVLLMERKGVERARIAERLHRSLGWVSIMLSLGTELCDEALRALHTGVLTQRDAQDLAKLTPDKQREHLAQLRGEGPSSVEAAVPAQELASASEEEREVPALEEEQEVSAPEALRERKRAKRAAREALAGDAGRTVRPGVREVKATLDEMLGVTPPPHPLVIARYEGAKVALQFVLGKVSRGELDEVLYGIAKKAQA